MGIPRQLARLAGLFNAGGLLDAHRNKIINGDFDYWQRATSQTANGFGSDDRWRNDSVGATKTHSRQAFAVGQTQVPGDPLFFSRTVVTSVAGASNYAFKFQPIEGVRTLEGQRATLTFWAKADAARNIAVEFSQVFGTGGSPSATVTGIGARLFALTTAWQKFTYSLVIPPIAGATLGTNGNDSLNVAFWFDAGSSFNARAASLGHQSGTFDIAHVSLVPGDATGEADPFSPRHPGAELALCQRYYETALFTGYNNFGGVGPGWNILMYPFKVVKRSTPTIAFTGMSYSACSAIVATQVTNQALNATVTASSSGGGSAIGTFTADAEL